jgi:hypothetical protein
MGATIKTCPNTGRLGARQHTDGWTPFPRATVVWGVVVGIVIVFAPLALWWLPSDIVYAVVLVLIAAVYVGFAVADGRIHVIVAESITAGVFVIVAAAGTTTAWMSVAGLFAHGLKDLWQHRSCFVANTRWWPPFCIVTDWAAALGIATALTFHAAFL